MTKFITLTLCISSLVALAHTSGGHGGHDHFIIHVPYYIKTLKHTHTITKHIHHKSEGGGGGDHYEVLGYTVGHPIDLGGHDGGWHLGGHEGGNEIGGHYDGGFDGGQEEHEGY